MDSDTQTEQQVTTQLTSKKLKLHSALAVLLIFAGVILFFFGISSDPRNTLMAFLGILIGAWGLILYIVAAVRIWWHHA